MRSARYGYIFNPWSDGQLILRNESQTGRSFPAMQSAAVTSPEIAARVQLFLRRVPEELYDFEAEAEGLLAADPHRRQRVGLVREPEPVPRIIVGQRPILFQIPCSVELSIPQVDFSQRSGAGVLFAQPHRLVGALPVVDLSVV